ncbi:MAG: hypothetical protein QOF54_2476 [Solirubrobacteraceae bacterium]|nr:hypothetical protein [Solirubrobacteraceae bacterium]
MALQPSSASVVRSQRAAAPTRVLPAAALGSISGAIGADDTAYRVLRSGSRSFRAVSPGQSLSARFGASTVSVRSGSATLGLQLTAAGYGGSLRPLAAVAPRAAAPNRVEYPRGGVNEWYANGPFGIEQGFTVDRRPSSSGATTLALRIAVSGNVRASIARGAGEIALRAPDGDALRYGAIAASDASGRGLPIRMALEGRAIVLRVDVASARFPLTIDPMIEQPQESPAPPGEGAEGRFGYSVALSANGTTALVGAPADNGLAGAAWVFTRSGSTWTQQGPKLTAPEAPAEAACSEGVSACGFGRSVALSADGATALIGAPRLDEARGAAWVFTRSGSAWTQFGEPLAPDGEARNSGSFGRSVALSGDGNTALVGAPTAQSTRGAAWTFQRSAGGFVHFGTALTAPGQPGPGDHFGRSVALSSDGATALVGAPGDASRAGAGWAFARSSGGWLPSAARLTPGTEAVGEARFGSSVALSAGGDMALIGAPTDAEGVGAAWTFQRTGSITWAQLGPKLTAEGEVGAGQFGWSVALSADGQTALIGAPHDDAAIGAAWTLIRAGAGWTQEAEQLSGAAEPGKDLFGTGAALSGDSSTALIGAPRAAHRLGSVWTLLGPASPLPSVPPVPPVVPVQPTPEGPTGQSNAQSNQASVTSGARSGVLGSTTSALPPPRLALTGNVIPLGGVVRVKLPGAKGFTLLTAGEQIPFGSIIDATLGRVAVTTADAHGVLQTMVFYQGEFKLTQHRDGMVVSILFGGDFSKCPRTLQPGHLARASARAKRTVRKLWAEGHGSYSTKGNYATGAVLGTRWLTADLCEGTLIRVLTDRVAVTNLVNGKRVTVTAGHSYLAPARRKRHG